MATLTTATETPLDRINALLVRQAVATANSHQTVRSVSCMRYKMPHPTCFACFK